MATITFVGDLHLGYTRKSYTNPTASGRYRQALIEQANLGYSSTSDNTLVQVGDVFDKYRGTDQTLADGARICSGVDLVLAGNHDISNTITHASTLEMCQEVAPHTDFVTPCKEGGNSLQIKVVDNAVQMVCVPYCYTQTQFEASIVQALKEAKASSLPSILVLHTNYNLEFEKTETTNNLPEATTKKLLTEFDYVVSGHEHNYTTHLKGRVIMTGSVFPVSMAELQDKYTHTYDTETKEFTKQLIWSAKDHSVSVDVEEMPDTLPEGTQFVTVTGRIKSEDISRVQKHIVSWWKTSPNLLVCKPEFEVIRRHKESTSLVSSDLVGFIRNLLKPSAQVLLDQMVERINNDIS